MKSSVAHRTLLLLGLAFASANAPAADARKGLAIEVPTLKGFKAPINEGNRQVALVTGTEAKPSIVAGQVEVKGFRLETYRYDPDKQVELVAESPLGVFGPTGASSDQRITLNGADGRFAIAGEGWNWNKVTGLLVISNRVETRLRRPGVATNLPPIGVRARRFEYRMTTGDARFVGDCEAEEPERARLRAGELASRLTVRAERPNAITATNGVTIELLRPGHRGRAAAAAASYTAAADGEEIELTGEPTWQFGPGEGSAELLVLQPGRDSYSARGNARLRLRRFGKDAPVADAAPAGSPLEVACTRIDGSPREVVFTGPVTASRSNRLELHAERVVATLEPATETREARASAVTATGTVSAVIASRTGSMAMRGETMRYTLGEHESIEVEGSPSWEGATHQGRAERFVIHPEVPTFQAIGAVEMAWQTVRGQTNVPPVLVSADRMVVEPADARFVGKVRARRETWDLTAAEVTLPLGTNGAPREVLARGDVLLDYRLAPKRARADDVAMRVFQPLGTSVTEEMRHWKIEAAEVRAGLAGTNAEPASLDATGRVRVRNPGVLATGNQLRYRAEDGLLRLTGDAQMRAASGLEIIGERDTALAFDPRNARFQVDGRWRRMIMPATALRGGASTNRPPRP